MIGLRFWFRPGVGADWRTVPAFALVLAFGIEAARAQSGYQTIRGTSVYTVVDQARGIATFSNQCGSQTLTQRQLQAGAIPDEIIPCPRPGREKPGGDTRDSYAARMREAARSMYAEGDWQFREKKYREAESTFEKAALGYRHGNDPAREQDALRYMRLSSCHKWIYIFTSDIQWRVRSERNLSESLRYLRADSGMDAGIEGRYRGICREFPNAMRILDVEIRNAQQVEQENKQHDAAMQRLLRQVGEEVDRKLANQSGASSAPQVPAEGASPSSGNTYRIKTSAYWCGVLSGTYDGQNCKSAYRPRAGGGACRTFREMNVDDAEMRRRLEEVQNAPVCVAKVLYAAKVNTITLRVRLRGYVTAGRDETVNDPVVNSAFRPSEGQATYWTAAAYFLNECVVETCLGK